MNASNPTWVCLGALARAAIRVGAGWRILACILLLQAPISGYFQSVSAQRLSKLTPLSEELVEEKAAIGQCPTRRLAESRPPATKPAFTVATRRLAMFASLHRPPPIGHRLINGLLAPLRC